MTEAQAHQLFSLIAAAFPTVKVGETTIRLYVQAMREFSAEDGSAALGIILDTALFWPSPAVVRAAMREAQARRYAALPALPPPEEEPLTDEQREWARAELARRSGNLSLRGLK